MNRMWIFLAMTLVLTRGGYAQWVNNPVVNTPVCTASESQILPQIVSDDEGGVVLVWQDKRSSGNQDIYAQRLDSAGYTQWQAQGADVNTRPSAQSQLAATTDGDHGVVVVWNDALFGIGVQRTDDSGNKIWGQYGVSLTSSASSLAYPEIARDLSGATVAVWADARLGYHNIYAQRINDNGSKQWNQFGTQLKPVDRHQYFPVVLARDSGGIIAAWVEQGLGVVAQAVASDGSFPWGNAGRVICTVSGGSGAEIPQIVTDGDNGAIIAWTDSRNAAGTDIYAQRISNAGNAMWDSEGKLICASDNDQHSVMLTADASGGAILAWLDQRTTNPGVYAQRIGSNGALAWTQNGIGVCTLASSAPSKVVIVTDSANGAFVAWEDSRSGLGEDIYAQHVSAAGVVSMTANGIPVCSADERQTNPTMVEDGHGNAILCWEDTRLDGVNKDIYAAKITPQGLIPVEFLAFHAIWQDDAVLLQWSTATEINNRGFEIQRSGNGVDWTVVGFIPSQGNGIGNREYSYLDYSAQGARWWYRLKQIDYDGTFAYSPVLMVSSEVAHTIGLGTLYPQPATATATIPFTLQYDESVTIGVYNALGRCVLRVVDQSAIAAGSHTITVASGSLESGVYLVQLTTARGVTSWKPLIVQR